MMDAGQPCAHLGNSSPQEGADQELEPLEFSLQYHQCKRRASIHARCAVFNGLDLPGHDGLQSAVVLPCAS